MNKTIYRFMSVILTLTMTLGSFYNVEASPKYSPQKAAITYVVSITGIDTSSGVVDGIADRRDNIPTQKTASMLLMSTVVSNNLQAAVNAAKAGDVLIVSSGVYNEQVTISKPLTLQADGVAKVNGFIIRADDVTIQGFDITSPKTSTGFGIGAYNARCKIVGNYIHDTWWDGILLDGTSSNCLISGNKIERASQSGVEVRGTNHVIQNNEVFDTLQTPPGSSFTRSQGADADGFRFFGSGHKFLNNYVHNIAYGTHTNPDPHIDCFQTWRDSSPRTTAHDILFEGNRCMLSWDGAMDYPAKVFQLEGAPYNLTMIGNVSRSRMVAIISDGSHNLSITNNIFIGSGSLSWGVELNSGVYDVIIRDNIYYHQENGYGYLPKNVPGLDAGHNCVYTTTRTPPGNSKPGDIWGKDPLFVDYGNDNFNLRPESPCLGIGAFGTSVTPVVTSASITPTILAQTATTTLTATITAMPLPTATPFFTNTPAATGIPPTPSLVPTLVVTNTALPTSTKVLPLPSASPTVVFTPTFIFVPTSTSTKIPPTLIASATPLPQSSYEKTFDDKDGGFIYSSGWENISKRRSYGDSYKLTRQSGASVTFTFTGEAFSILYTGGPSFKKIDVYLDSVLVGTINEKLNSNAFQQRWNYRGALTPGPHTVQLVFTSGYGSGTFDAAIIRSASSTSMLLPPNQKLLPTPTQPATYTPTSISTLASSPTMVLPADTSTFIPPTVVPSETPMPESPTSIPTSTNTP